MPTKKQVQASLDELTETIQATITLIEQLIDKPDPNTIRQLQWNLGWHQGIYHTEITEDPYYETQALNLAQKILKDILEATTTDKAD